MLPTERSVVWSSISRDVGYDAAERLGSRSAARQEDSFDYQRQETELCSRLEYKFTSDFVVGTILV